MREFGRVLRGPDYAARLVARALQVRRRHPHGESPSSRCTPGGTPEPVDAGRHLPSSRAKRVLLATGVREKSRAARLIGGDKAGRRAVDRRAAGPRLSRSDQKPFSRPVVLGTELVSFSALLTCRHIGIRPVAMVEPAGARHARAGRPACCPVPAHTADARHRHWSPFTATSRVDGVDLVATRTARRGMLDTDGVIVTGGFLPEASLLAGPATSRSTRRAAGRTSTSSGAAPTRPISPPAISCAPSRPPAGAGPRAVAPARTIADDLNERPARAAATGLRVALRSTR